jgi:predicted RND superfamily exporter protein
MEALKREGKIGGVASVNRFIVTAEEQEQARRFIQDGGRAFDISRIRATFLTASDAQGFVTEGLYDDYFTKLNIALSSADTVVPSVLETTPLAPLIEPFITDIDGNYTAVTYVAPLKDLWTAADTATFKKMITEKLTDGGIAESDYILTGANLLSAALKDIILSNLRSSLLFAVLSIGAVLIIYYRSVTLLLLSLSPLMAGLAIIAGIMVLAGIDFNFFNILILPMIVGIGIDDGVHLTNTFRRVTTHNAVREIARTGRAVILTSLTTLAGFGSLALSHYPGLKSMGYVAVIGISACLAASLVIMPAVFALILRGRKTAHSDPAANVS